MASPVRLDIDLRFSMSSDDSRPAVVGSVSADGSDVTVSVTEGAIALPDTRVGLAWARALGAELARFCITVSLRTRHGVVATAGAVRAPWYLRLVTRSPHLRVRSLSALRALRRDGRGPDAQRFTLPPTTLFPPAPTALRRVRRRPTTTHYLPGSGRILRTGALIALGEWRLAFFREEFADHGRPYGGRVGGEFAVQRPQPERRMSVRRTQE